MTPTLTRTDVETIVRSYGRFGRTSAEIEREYGIDHGKVSGKLSVLHRDCRLYRTTERRAGHSVYLAPEYAHPSIRLEHGSNRPCPHCGLRATDDETTSRDWSR